MAGLGRRESLWKIGLAIQASPATVCASFLRHWRAVLARPVGESNR